MDAGEIKTRRLLHCSRFLLLVAAGAALPACHSNGASSGGVDAYFVSCSGETRATPYQPGMQVTSDNGVFVVKLLSNTFTDASGKTTDEAFAKGVDVWSVETQMAATMTPIDGLMIAVSPFMPDHGHGTTPVGVMPAGGGLYTISPVNLYMAGYWEVTLSIVDPPIADDASAADASADAAPAAPISDNAVLKICVPD